MSGRIYMKVIVRNESPALLRLKDSWTSGDWTPGGWAPDRFPEAPPQSTLQWQAEGDIVPLVGVPWDGVEARVRYDVVHNGHAVGELYIFANSPVVESQYGNTFRVHAPPGFYAAYVDAKGQGKAAVLEISFRRTRRVAVRGFRPSIHGLQFSNTD